MDNYYIDSPADGKRRVALSDQINEGLTGTIHDVVGESGLIAKLYKEPKDLPGYRDKIAAMLAAPPNLPAFSSDGHSYVQIAWPTAAVLDDQGQFRGFVMPKVAEQSATVLENVLYKKSRQRKNIPEFYGARVLLAANLAGLMAELHTLGHYMVDMKPLNTMFYPHAWYMAVLDTDGFSINGTRRFPAYQYSDEYIAPEARGMKPEQLGLQQDLFALAVIIFRLLNNGVHPYAGVATGSANAPTTLQERIDAGLYGYGLVSNNKVGPSPASIHSFFEDETRRLFDRAFEQTVNRPTASEWRDHLRGLINNQNLVKCATNPNEHAHFSKGCGLCVLEQHKAAVRVAAGIKPSSSKAPIQSSGAILGSIPIGSPSFIPQPAADRNSLLLTHLSTGAGLSLGLALLLWMVTASGCRAAGDCQWFNWRGGSVPFNSEGLFVLAFIAFGSWVGRDPSTFGLQNNRAPSWRGLLAGAGLGFVAGFILYYPLWLAFAVLNLIFAHPLAVALILAAVGALGGVLVFQKNFGAAPAGSAIAPWSNFIQIYPEGLARALLLAGIVVIGAIGLSNRGQPQIASPPAPIAPLAYCQQPNAAQQASAAGAVALRSYLQQCATGPFVATARSTLESLDFGSAATCISTSCSFNQCLATYSNDFPSGARLVTLQNQAQARGNSEQCKPRQPSAPPVRSATLEDGDAALNTAVDLIGKNQLAQGAALAQRALNIYSSLPNQNEEIIKRKRARAHATIGVSIRNDRPTACSHLNVARSLYLEVDNGPMVAQSENGMRLQGCSGG
ncbi:MAG: hypothetical protein ACRERZ_03025, partial [Gammaproteobacteria bacterium]